MVSLMFISIYRDEIRLKLNSVLENYQPSGQPNVSQKDANSASTKLEADLKQLEQLKSDNDYLLQLSEMDEEAQMRAKLDKYELLFNKADPTGSGDKTPVPDRIDKAIDSMKTISKNNFANTLLDYAVKESNVNDFNKIFIN